MKSITISSAVLAAYVLFAHPGHGGEKFQGGREYMRNKVDMTDSTALDMRVRMLPGERVEIVITNTSAGPILYHDILGINEDRLPGIWIRGCYAEQKNCENEMWRHPYIRVSEATTISSLQLETLEAENAVYKEFSLREMLLKFGIDETHNISHIQVKIWIVLDEYASTYAEYTSTWMDVKMR